MSSSLLLFVDAVVVVVVVVAVVVVIVVATVVFVTPPCSVVFITPSYLSVPFLFLNQKKLWFGFDFRKSRWSTIFRLHIPKQNEDH